MKKPYMNEYTRDFLQSREKTRVSENRNWAWWMQRIEKRIGAGFGILLLTIVLIGGGYFYKKQRSSALLPLSEIVVKGQNKFTRQSDIEGVLKDTLSENFVNIQTEKVRLAILALPWILDTKVTKHWPGTLQVDVTEREPRMRWGEKRVVDGDGVIFKAPHDQELQAALASKPILVGADDKAYKVLKGFETFATAFPDYDRLGVVSFELTQHQSWEVKLKSGIKIKFGRKLLATRAKRLAHAVKRKVMPDMKKVDTIHMTYHQGFAVQWKSASTKTQDGKPVLIPVALDPKAKKVQ